MYKKNENFRRSLGVTEAREVKPGIYLGNNGVTYTRRELPKGVRIVKPDDAKASKITQPKKDNGKGHKPTQKELDDLFR